mmetsp:Transcript_60508/g.130599  ORF Transcript_60508/g.130599 Transcript_60508/m.130599 type:complete len:587 (+) Transcript_60508:25-1785(+)
MRVVTLAAAAAAAPLPTSVTVDPTAPKPNILILLVDDMGYSDTSLFGSPNASTPHIDRLASRGVKLTQWISGASICTPSRASLQTGRYPIRTGCTGTVEKFRVIPTPSNPGGLDPTQHLGIATALKQAGYATGMSGKWHLGVSGNEALKGGPDSRFAPNANGYDSYLGSPYTNTPMCAMDGDGVSDTLKSSPGFCYMTANTTVVQQPLRLENFTGTITDHAVWFLRHQASKPQRQPWFFFMSYFHVHTPLFTNRTNRGRSRGGQFGDNVEEMDDSVGRIVATVDELGFTNDTLIFFTSDNGPYQEEGWEFSGRTNLYNAAGEHVGRMKGGKGQLFEGGVRMPGAAVWPGVIQPGTVSDTMVSTVDIFPTALALAGVKVNSSYAVDGRDMTPVLRGTTGSQHDVFLHYCGFTIVAARVSGRFKVFWATPKWYTNDPKNGSVCLQCCNGVNPFSRLTGAIATQLCGCEDKDQDWHDPPLVFDMATDVQEDKPLTGANWPADAGISLADVVSKALLAKETMEMDVHPKPDITGAGTCTAGLPAVWRQQCCPGCHAVGFPFPECKTLLGRNCTCDKVPQFGHEEEVSLLV